LQVYEFSYKFDTVLYLFLKKGTSDRCIGIVQVSAYTPFHFSFTVPFRNDILFDLVEAILI